MRPSEASFFDFHWVLPTLAIGGRIPDGEYASFVQKTGVTHAVDLRAEECDDRQEWARHRVRFLSLPTPDLRPVLLADLDRGVDWIRNAVRSGGVVYVHCEHGIGRSVLLSLCFLVSEGIPPLAAMKRIKALREKASPSPSQIDALLEWCRAYSLRTGVAIELCDWNALSDAAYRPKFWSEESIGALR